MGMESVCLLGVLASDRAARMFALFSLIGTFLSVLMNTQIWLMKVTAAGGRDVEYHLWMEILLMEKKTQ